MPKALCVRAFIRAHPWIGRRARVFPGAGKLLDQQDLALTQEQSFYAVQDGDGKAFDSSFTSAMTRSDLTAVASLTTSVSIPAASKGWYFDLGKTNNVAWRINVSPATSQDVALFSATLTSGDACNPSGKGHVCAVDYANGESVVQDPKDPTKVVDSLPLDHSPTDNMLANIDDKLTGIVGDAGGGVTEVKLKPKNPGGGNKGRLISWRELTTVD